MRARIVLPFLMLVLVLTSGCLSSGQTTTRTTSYDFITLGEPEIFPGKTLVPESNIILRTEIANVGLEKAFLLVDREKLSNNPENGDGVLIDHKEDLYRFSSFTMTPQAPCVSVSDADLEPYGADELAEVGSACYIEVLPGSSFLFQWKLESPSEEEILGLTDTANFRFQAKYLGVAETNTYIYFASLTEVAQKTYTREDLALSGPNVATAGPLLMNFETLESQPIPSGEGEDWTLFVEAKNRGRGIARLSSVEVEKPEQLERIDKKCKLFALSEEGVLVADEALTEEMGLLRIYGGKSSKVSCALTTPEDVTILTPYRFTTRAYYMYSLFDELEVKTKPSE